MTARPKTWVLGIDPGFGNTGAVLRLIDNETPAACACWQNDNTKDWDIQRALSICIPMIETIIGWIEEHEITCLEVCIEYPIYNGNPSILMMQMSLYTLIQAYVYDYLVPLLDEVYLTRVNNRTSKVKLTNNGAATKDQMIACSRWANFKDQGVTHNQAHTLADAYAHSLSAGVRALALHNIMQYAVDTNYEE